MAQNTSGKITTNARKETINAIIVRVEKSQKERQIDLPPNYSEQNAMKSAWLILQELQDKNGNFALDICTRESIANALLYMLVQGLNPGKKQCYFIAYGKQLVCQPSYFGSMTVAKRVNPNIKNIIAATVYKGDILKYKIIRGEKCIVEHEQKLENIGKDIVAAYAEIIDYDNNVIATQIMTFEQIKQSWKQSKLSPVNEDGSIKPNTTHSKFTSDMAEKTVIAKVCKPIINSSDDSNLFLTEAIQHADKIRDEYELAEEIDKNANQEILDIEEDEDEIDDNLVDTGSNEDDKPIWKANPNMPNNPGF